METEILISVYTLIYISALAGLYWWAFHKYLGICGKIYVVLLIGLEILNNRLMYWYQIPNEWNLVHQAVLIGLLIFFSRARLLESIFVVFIILNYFISVFYVNSWIYHHFYPVYGVWATGISIFFAETAGMIPLIIYFKVVIMPMLKINGLITRYFWRNLWLIPVVFYGISCYASWIQGKGMQNTGSMSIYLTLNNVLNLFVCWIMGTSLQDSEDIARLKNERGYLSIMAKQQENINEKVEQARRMRHDMRHFMVMINDFIRREDMDGMKEYMLEYSASLDQNSWKNIAYCSDPTINAVAGYYLTTAENEGIKTQFDCRISGELPLTSMEISGIFGNLLENALEACRRMNEGRRFIQVSMRCESGGFLVLVVENSYGGQISKKGERFLSSKRNAPGIGLESVRNVVEKKGGILKVEYDQEIFRVNLLLS